MNNYAPSATLDRSAKTATTQLPPGIHEGIVVSTILPNNLVQVRMVKYGRNVICVWAAGIISGLLGFKTTYAPPKKTVVLVYITGTDTNYIIGNMPSQFVDTNNQVRTVTGPKAPNNHANQIYNSRNSVNLRMFASHKPPVDLVEGEIDVSNLLGVGLTLLRNMASLQGGDLARVECCLLDDMVRIISDTFKHYTAFGDYRISNDGGRLNVVWHGSSNDYEAWGSKAATDAKLQPNAAGDGLNTSTVNGQTDDGRWRFSQYIGWLGNFINLFVTDPVNAIGQIAANQFRSGKARLHVNNDGSVLIQSVADIVLEKVVRIPVPNPLKLEDDPTGNRSDQVLGGQSNLATWTPSSSSNLFEMAFELREYARWLNNSLSLGRFRQMNLDYQVPTEAETPAPDLNSDSVDVQTQNAGITNWRIAYACYRIYRDGSMQQVDAYGNAMTTTATGIQISAAQDLLLQAAGSVNIVAGRDVNVVAQNNVNLTAVKQALRLKGETALLLFCHAGNMVLEVATGFIIKLIGIFGLNNNLSVDTSGNLTTSGNMTTSASILASQTVQALSLNAVNTATDGLHSGHAYVIPEVPSIPAPKVVPDDFQFQADYGGPQLYATLTDQMADIGDIETAGVWDLSSDAIPGKGTPWPGAQKMKKPISNVSLNEPSTQSVAPAKSQGMTTQDPIIHYQI